MRGDGPPITELPWDEMQNQLHQAQLVHYGELELDPVGDLPS